MPTTRPRHSITETDEVAAALRDAAREWPEDRDSPGKLIAHLLVVGHRAIGERHDDALAQRRRRIEENAGALTGVYPENYLAELREDFPE